MKMIQQKIAQIGITKIFLIFLFVIALSYGVYAANSNSTSGTGIIVGNVFNGNPQMYNISILHNKWFYNQSNTISISIFDVENNLVDPQSLTAYITRNNNREYEQFKKERTGIYTIKFNPIPQTYKNEIGRSHF